MDTTATADPTIPDSQASEPSGSGDPARFLTADGRSLAIVPGFGHRIRHRRASVFPRESWSEDDYETAATARIARSRRYLKRLEKAAGPLEGKRILEIGCGAGIDTFLTALSPVGEVVGVDRRLPLFESTSNSGRARRLLSRILELSGESGDVDTALARLPMSFEAHDVTRLPLAESSFDIVTSFATLEHVMPIAEALTALERVVRPAGMMVHTIDPYYWLRGCHRDGMVDIPWAHARLTSDDFHRFVEIHEGPEAARRRSRQLGELNQLTLDEWYEALKASRFQILSWKETHSHYSAAMLEESPEVTATLLEGISVRDLVHSQIRVVMRKPARTVTSPRKTDSR